MCFVLWYDVWNIDFDIVWSPRWVRKERGKERRGRGRRGEEGIIGEGNYCATEKLLGERKEERAEDSVGVMDDGGG